jgi:hypothetical protein
MTAIAFTAELRNEGDPGISEIPKEWEEAASMAVNEMPTAMLDRKPTPALCNDERSLSTKQTLLQ